MQQRYPGLIRESASPSGNSAVFKNWAFRQYQAPTVTYEVGDKTGSAQLHELATFAADSAMRILLNESRPDASTPVTGSQRSEEHTSELQSLMRISYAVFCLLKTQVTTANRVSRLLRGKNTTND